MAMTMTGEVQLPATREVVWAKLNDAEVLKACIPGCEELNKNSETEFQAVAVTKIGPVKARFKGNVHLTDLNPPNGYKISGEGDGGVAGFAKGGATVALTEKDGKEYVFIAEDNTAAAVEVTTGPRLGERIEVQSGLNSGDLLIITRVKTLKPGQNIISRNQGKSGEWR